MKERKKECKKECKKRLLVPRNLYTKREKREKIRGEQKEEG